jgi:tetratricopeptide (TPR) repeat protein
VAAIMRGGWQKASRPVVFDPWAAHTVRYRSIEMKHFVADRRHFLGAGLLAVLIAGLVVLQAGSGWGWIRALFSPSPEMLLQQGIEAENAGQPDQALAHYRKVLERQPERAEAHYNIGQILNERKQYTEAQREYEAALRAKPDFQDARLNLGLAKYRQRQYEGAAQDFRQVLAADPKNATAHFDLGLALLNLGKTDEAIESFRAALREDPKRAEAQYYLGLALERQGRHADARAALEKAIELNPSVDGYLAMARVYAEQGDQRRATETMKKAAQLLPAAPPRPSQ